MNCVFLLKISKVFSSSDSPCQRREDCRCSSRNNFQLKIVTISDLPRNLKNQDSRCQFRDPGNIGSGNAERKSIKIARASSRRMPHVARARCMRFYAQGTSRRSNPPSRTSRERPVATLLSTSLRLLPPLSLHPDSRLVRIVTYGVTALVGATPSGSASIPFHSVQPFNDVPDCLSNRSSIRIPLDDLHSVPSISTAAADANSSSPNQRY